MQRRIRSRLRKTMRRTNRNRVDTAIGNVCVCVFMWWMRSVCVTKTGFSNTTGFSNLKALDGHWGYFYVASGSQKMVKK